MKNLAINIILIIVFVAFQSCNKYDSASDFRSKDIGVKEKYYGTYKGWNGKDSIKVILYEKAYWTLYRDSTNVSYDYDIDHAIIKFHTPRYQMTRSFARLAELYKVISYDYKEEVLFFDLIDSTGFKGLNYTYIKRK